VTKRGRKVALFVIGTMLILAGAVVTIFAAWMLLAVSGHLYDAEPIMKVVDWVVAIIAVAVFALWGRFVERDEFSN
jgi:chromate transport protein ChrA